MVVIGAQGHDHRGRRIETEKHIRRLLASNPRKGIQSPEEQHEACYEQEETFHDGHLK
jgi:hypothetical protein